MASIVRGPTEWRMSRDDEGHREYKITFLIESDDALDGPANIINTPGLPLIGSRWAFDNDTDLWAWCRTDCDVKPVSTRQPNFFWEVEFTFSTKPWRWCKDHPIEDPVLEPAKISGNFINQNHEAKQHRNGALIMNSAFEPVRGPKVEFEQTQPTVVIEQNLATLDITLLTSFKDTVNDRVLWGLPARTIRLRGMSWEEQFYGSCYKYYKRKLEFVIDYNTHDRMLLDEGTKVLNGHWNDNKEWVLDKIGGADPSPFNPAHFIKATDPAGNPARLILDGLGRPVTRKLIGAIEDIDNSAGFIITSTSHGLVDADSVAIYGVEGITGINGKRWGVLVQTADTFLLEASEQAAIDSFQILEEDYTPGTGYWSKLTARQAGINLIEYYPEGNLLLLGIPAVL